MLRFGLINRLVPAIFGLLGCSGFIAAPAPAAPAPTSLAQPAVPGAALFGSGAVGPIQIDIAPEDMESLRKNPREDVRAMFQFGGSIYTNIAVHLKGRSGSFRSLDDRPGLTLTFDKFAPGQQLDGLTRLHLNNSVEDPSFANDWLGSEIFRAAGLPATRTAHALVTVNGRKLGLYVVKESFTPEFLRAHFKRTDGNLYENAPTDEDPGLMKRNSGSGADDQSDLKALLAAASEPDLAKRWQRLEQVLDLDSFLSFMAMEMIVGHRDGYCLAANNYRLYFNPGPGRFAFLPTGMDQLFGRADLPLRASMGGPVARAVMEMPQGRRLYLERAALLFTNVFKSDALTNRAAQLLAQLRPVLTADEARDLGQHIAVVQEKILRRAANLARQLSEPELKPLQFDNGAVKLANWRAVDPPEGGRLDQTRSPDGRAGLHIAAGLVTSASWRTKVRLLAGRYRFEGSILTSSVKPLAYGKNKGAGLRVSEARRATPHQLAGDTPWTKVGVDWELTAPETDVELMCELRASQGSAWFDLESLRLIHLQ